MKTKTLESLVKKIRYFNKARGWKPTPGDLAKSISIEAAELLEKFQWDESDSRNRKLPPKNVVETGEEVADVFWYVVNFCDSFGIKLTEVVADKLEKNKKKYPAKMFKGKHNDKFYKAQKKKYREGRKKN